MPVIAGVAALVLNFVVSYFPVHRSGYGFDFLFSIFVVSSMGCWTGPGFNCQLIVSIIVASHFKAEPRAGKLGTVLGILAKPPLQSGPNACPHSVDLL